MKAVQFTALHIAEFYGQTMLMEKKMLLSFAVRRRACNDCISVIKLAFVLFIDLMLLLCFLLELKARKLNDQKLIEALRQWIRKKILEGIENGRRVGSVFLPNAVGCAH